MGTTIQEEVRQGLGAWYDALPQDAIAAAENTVVRKSSRDTACEHENVKSIPPLRICDIARAFSRL